MLVLNFIALIVLIIAMGILYQMFLEKRLRNGYGDDGYDQIRKYLLTESSLAKSKKPILWIHVPYEYNSRSWSSFGSRSSYDLNQPYLYLTVKSIIKCCDESFTICIVDDSSFARLIPNWTINMDYISEPIKCYIRQMALAKLIYAYGGVTVPISFLCFRDLKSMYERGTQADTMFVCENYDANITSTSYLFYPNAHFMGAKKENETMREFISFMERTISSDFTAQSQFLGDFDRWCNSKINKNKMRLISGIEVGTRTIDDEPVTVETLLGEDYIKFYGKMYGIWIPDRMILKRNKYEWFARMSPDQIFKSHFILAKYFVLALAPDSTMGVIEPLENQPDWISFWRTPLGNGTLNIFGPMPQNLGNDVPRAKNAGKV